MGIVWAAFQDELQWKNFGLDYFMHTSFVKSQVCTLKLYQPNCMFNCLQNYDEEE